MSQALNILQGGKAVDDRGFVSFVNEFNFDDVKRFYQVVNHNNAFIRAWHGHISEAKYVYVPSGAAIVGAVKMSDEYLLKINNGERVTDFSTMKAEMLIISSANPCVLYIPPGYFNGFMNLKENS